MDDPGSMSRPPPEGVAPVPGTGAVLWGGAITGGPVLGAAPCGGPVRLGLPAAFGELPPRKGGGHCL